MADLSDLISQAQAHIAAGRLRDAEWAVNKLLARDPRNAAVISIAARMDWAKGHRNAAVARLQEAIKRNGKSAELRETLGIFLFLRGDREGSEAELALADALNPNLPAVVGLLTQFAMDQLDWRNAVPLARRLIALSPENSSAWNMSGACQMAVGKLLEADASFVRSMELDAGAYDAATNRSLNATYRDDIPPEEVLRIHVDASKFFKAPGAPQRRPESYRHKRIRIGYVSGDFRNHSVAVFLMPLLQHHDHHLFEIHAYSSVTNPDGITARLKQCCDHWHEVGGLTDDAVADRIRNDEIDILVDLAGYTTATRLGIFARQPAPLQASWLGYPNTTGMSEIDVRLTDRWADPQREGDRAQSWHSEKLVRLPGHFFCYAGAETEAIQIGPPPVATTGIVRFGVPTNISKVRPAMVEVWARVMHAVPHSRIDIKALSADAEPVAAWLLPEFAKHGIGEDRVRLLGRSGLHEYFELHNEWDLIFDTAPFNGHTTTCHALWMGVPVVTLAGEMHASRMGASILTGAGFPELIASDADEFVDIATKLATDIDGLKQFRSSLRDRLKASPVMNGERFAREFESTIAGLVRALERGPS